MMRILGIETSCDETAAAVVNSGRRILSQVVASSLKEHQRYGGIIPEIASRRQIEWINPIVARALREANVNLRDLDGIAVTHQPGLIGSLLVGVSYARALSYATGLPLVEVDHIQAHLYANCLIDKNSEKKSQPKLPAIGLVVSGGHTSLFYLSSFSRCQLLGETRDDAVGETFDKVARLWGLGYPGGPAIDRLTKGKEDSSIRFPCADLSDSWDFSFSGIKTAVLYYSRRHQGQKNFPLPQAAHAFQKSIVAVLVKKCIAGCLKKNVKTLLVGGGVAANSALREELTQKAQEHRIKIFFPPVHLCLDNAAMIAGLGYHLLKRKGVSRARFVS